MSMLPRMQPEPSDGFGLGATQFQCFWFKLQSSGQELMLPGDRFSGAKRCKTLQRSDNAATTDTRLLKDLANSPLQSTQVFRAAIEDGLLEEKKRPKPRPNLRHSMGATLQLIMVNWSWPLDSLLLPLTYLLKRRPRMGL